MIVLNGHVVVNALVFDKDGTLLDTERVWYKAYQRLLDPFGLTHSLAVHRKQMSGSAETCMRTLQEAHPGSAFAALPLEDTLRLRIDAYHAVRDEVGIVPMPGAAEFLAFCHSQDIWMAVATSAHRDDTEREFAALGWSKYFRAIVTGDEVEQGKPAPDIYLKAARQLFMNPIFCAAFEDSLPGLRSAHAARMRTVFMRDAHFDIEPPNEAHLVFSGFQAVQADMRVT